MGILMNQTQLDSYKKLQMRMAVLGDAMIMAERRCYEAMHTAEDVDAEIAQQLLTIANKFAAAADVVDSIVTGMDLPGDSPHA